MSATRSEQAWLDEARVLTMRVQLPAAQTTLMQALTEYPASVELRRLQAGILQQMGCGEEAKAAFGALLVENPGDVASAFSLARILKEQGRMAATAATMRTCLYTNTNLSDANLAINAIELLDECDRKQDAADIAEAAIEANPSDARLHAYAGMLETQLGEFDRAHAHYLFALRHDDKAWEWHVPIGLSSTQRYHDGTHADFGLFREGLHRVGLGDQARAELHFALGKAHDDIGQYVEAARHFREGNAIAHRLTHWSRKAWRRTVDSRLASRPFTISAGPVGDFRPVFIVGMPRSGTTLLAELLSRYPNVCNRGELPWIAKLAERPTLTGNVGRSELQHAAAFYTTQTRRDDAGEACWFIDKQPLNFRYLDLMLALFPDARVIHCRRGARDIALSLWMQCFLEDVQGYAYDFDDIAVVVRDCERLMALWSRCFPDSIHGIRYEDLVSDPDSVVAELATWIGLPPAQARNAAAVAPTSAISTASLWQARQPIHTNSVDRANSYLLHIPELARWTQV